MASIFLLAAAALPTGAQAQFGGRGGHGGGGGHAAAGHAAPAARGGGSGFGGAHIGGGAHFGGAHFGGNALRSFRAPQIAHFGHVGHVGHSGHIGRTGHFGATAHAHAHGFNHPARATAAAGAHQNAQQRRAERHQHATQQRQAQHQKATQQRQARQQKVRTRQAAKASAKQAQRNRFAGRLHHQRPTRAQRLSARHPARWAWRHHRRAWFVPWYGGIYWPYAYADLFDYAFWPYGYYPGFWDYAYDGFFDGIFFPYGAPYSDYAYAGPYDTMASAAEPSSRRSAMPSSRRDAAPGELSQAAQQLCSQPGSGVTAWPFDRIQKTVAPTSDQQGLLDNLKDAAGKAAARFKEACPQNVPMTPPGRLAAMTGRLQATLDSVKLVRPPLEKFYDSLSDEQKARFNAMGPSIGVKRDRTASTAASSDGQASCSGDKSGLTSFPISQIKDDLNPTGEQSQKLDKLGTAMDDAVKTLQAACPDYVSRTPVGRLDTMQKRLQAMIKAADTIKPALQDFYASLNDEQKADFNQLGREAANTSR